MLHIHKNSDGSFYINVSVVDESVNEIIRFHGNFTMIDNSENPHSEADGFKLDIPTVELK